jgi:hypothetical protein
MHLSVDDRVWLRAFINALMSLLLLARAGNFLISYVTISFSRRTLPYAVCWNTQYMLLKLTGKTYQHLLTLVYSAYKILLE